ncbi:MAG: class I SAM-dependent methyltransferase [Flavobacteriales bacterium]|nr:class I SAM-dependent methyltransferase [Flavobacteriales bacterium]
MQKEYRKEPRRQQNNGFRAERKNEQNTDRPQGGRIYRSQAEAVVHALWSIFIEGRYADKVIEYTLKQDKRRGSADRAFIADTVYNVVRYKRLYMAVMNIEELKTEDDMWAMMAANVILSGGTLPPWEEFYRMSSVKINAAYERVKKIRAIRESIPDWMDELGRTSLPEIWEKEIAALNTQAPVVLRVNTLRTTKEEARKSFIADGVLTREVEGLPDALELTIRKNVFESKAFKEGWFEVQDASSQKVAILLNPQPGMRVVDACAGAGGKTLHIASLMQGKGSIIAMDLFEKKLEELKKRARRDEVSNITTRVIEGSKTIKRMADTADRLLLDVPCSGMGVLRRNPDAKWKLTPEFIDEVVATQAQILKSYSKILRVGGQMVYSTCSILPKENGEQVQRFLSENAGFSLVEEHSVFASVDGYDGFYMALLQRNE